MLADASLEHARPGVKQALRRAGSLRPPDLRRAGADRPAPALCCRQALPRPLTCAAATHKCTVNAQVAELVDALVSGTSSASCEGSSPFLGTTF
jgi:hypothetical protein